MINESSHIQLVKYTMYPYTKSHEIRDHLEKYQGDVKNLSMFITKKLIDQKLKPSCHNIKNIMIGNGLSEYEDMIPCII